MESINTTLFALRIELRYNLGRCFYKVFFKIDNSYDYIIKTELLHLLLNEKNGTLFGTNEREFIISDVRAWRPKAQAKKKKKYSPDDIQFEIKWEKGKYYWTDYNITQFKCSKIPTQQGNFLHNKCQNKYT